jgi:hypothetical protein
VDGHGGFSNIECEFDLPLGKWPIRADNVKLKRAYEAAAVEDGTRIPVDRLWPRGVSKKDAALSWDERDRTQHRAPQMVRSRS